MHQGYGFCVSGVGVLSISGGVLCIRGIGFLCIRGMGFLCIRGREIFVHQG